MSIAADLSPPQNDTVALKIPLVRAGYPLLAIVLIAISLLATLAWNGALIWLLSALINSP